MRSQYLMALVVCAVCGVAGAQEQNPTATERWPQDQQQNQPQMEMRGNVPVYKVTVVARDIPAINYFHRSGSTRIGFRVTSLLPQGRGTATVESQRGRMTIHAKFDGLVPANSFGVEYLTYVLWAITPEGRPVNLGEVLPQGSKSEITVTTDLQAYGLIVTAEPYFAVTMPSDLVVLQNQVLPEKTQGILETVDAHYSLLPRGAYVQTAGEHSVLHPITRNDRSPLELYEAINAVQIAEAEGADEYAADTLTSAKQDLRNARDMDVRGKEKKLEITYAREAVQAAEDARIMTVRKMRDADMERAREAKVQAEQQAQQSQMQAQQAAMAAQEQAAARARADAQAAEAEAAAEKARADQLAAQRDAQAQVQQANSQAEQMREQLKNQLNSVLQTRETARGLIVNMSDVLFGFNKYDLKGEAREKLAKISGILLAYPDLKLQVEGYTDNVGSEDYNQKLSEERADAVRDYLVSQGVSQDNISAAGYGMSDPVAENSTAAGRAQNRRVELVVSGNAIGVQEQGPGAGNPQPAAPNPPAQPTAPPPQPPAPDNPTGTSNVPPGM
ncbi:MAG TPA: OmpA family protein [Silvibacterium sp.]|nr:OmpA family protein [Silvibacterium sp.]